jgi:mannonate dehydratase
MPEVTLNLPGRDQKIEEYLNYIRYLGKAGIPYSTYAHMGNGIWRSGRATLPRGYTGADCDLSSPNLRGTWPHLFPTAWQRQTAFLRTRVRII